MRDYSKIGIDKIHCKLQAPQLVRNYDFHNAGWLLGGQMSAATLDEYGNKQLTATGVTFKSATNSLYMNHNVALDCLYVQFNPTTIDSNNDFELRHDFDKIIPQVQEQMYAAGVLNVEQFELASFMRIDPAVDVSSKYTTEEFLPALQTFSHYSRGSKDLNYAHGITLGNQSQEIGTYNRSLHLTTNKGIDVAFIPPNVTRNELRLLNKGARTWSTNLELRTIKDLYTLDAARIKDIHSEYFKKLRIRVPALTGKPIISHTKMLRNYQKEHGKDATEFYALDKMHFEFVAQYGISKTIDLLISPAIKSKGGNDLSSARTYRRKQIDKSLARYNRLTEYEATQRELITEFKQMFA
jgi:hypothetical protein